MYRFTGFTEKANNAMNRAIEKAEELGHNYIGSEHVLYGLIAEGSGVAFNVLNKLGITADDYERLMQEKIGTSSPTNLTTAYFTPRTKRILQMAKLAASKLGSNYVGTEHLLIAIIEDGESFAVRFLQMTRRALQMRCPRRFPTVIPSIKLPATRTRRTKTAKRKAAVHLKSLAAI